MASDELVVDYVLLREVVDSFSGVKSLVEGWHRDLPEWLADATGGAREVQAEISRGVEDYRISWQISCSALALSAGIIGGNADNTQLNLMEKDADLARYGIVKEG